MGIGGKWFCIAFLFLWACEETVTVDLPTDPPHLVIDALIGYNENDGNPITLGEIRLTLTAPFYNGETPPAKNAVVSITNETTGETYQLGEGRTGVFTFGFPDLDPDTEYTLQVLYEGELYTATETLSRASSIESVEQGAGFLFDETDETEIVVTINDLPNVGNYYVLLFGEDDYLVFDDDFFEGNTYTFSYFYEGLSVGDPLPIVLFGANKRFADYVSQLLVQSSDNSGGPFATTPATVRGNIYNTTNPDNFAFGYFAIGEADGTLFVKQ